MTDHDDIPPGKPPRPLNDVLGKVLQRMKMSDEASALSLFSSWRQIVGDGIADHVTPQRLEKRTLTVEVDDPAWATQLKFLESQLLSTLKEHVGDEVDTLHIKIRRTR
jgi:predicted nucleic acid-binding Zn ribbon protein